MLTKSTNVSSDCENTNARTGRLVDSCVPVSVERLDHRKQPPHVLWPVFDLILSGTNDTVLRNNLHIGTVVKVSCQSRYHLGIFKCPCTWQFKQCCDCGCKHVTRFRGSNLRETQRIHVTDAECPTSQFTHWVSGHGSPRHECSRPHQFFTSCTSTLFTSWDSTSNLSRSSRASTQLCSARELSHVQVPKRKIQTHSARPALRDDCSFEKAGARAGDNHTQL